MTTSNLPDQRLHALPEPLDRIHSLPCIPLSRYPTRSVPIRRGRLPRLNMRLARGRDPTHTCPILPVLTDDQGDPRIRRAQSSIRIFLVHPSFGSIVFRIGYTTVLYISTGTIFVSSWDSRRVRSVSAWVG